MKATYTLVIKEEQEIELTPHGKHSVGQMLDTRLRDYADADGERPILTNISIDISAEDWAKLKQMPRRAI